MKRPHVCPVFDPKTPKDKGGTVAAVAGTAGRRGFFEKVAQKSQNLKKHQ